MFYVIVVICKNMICLSWSCLWFHI
uniref:Uncharacterized protein n=1 Tax=Arundo donax TaxID=35708 RepID=A0A0A8Y2I3_ARUDO